MEFSASPFLDAFPPAAFTTFIGTTGPLTSAAFPSPATDLPTSCTPPSLRSTRNHPIRSNGRLIHHPQRRPLLPDFVMGPDDSSPDETESGLFPADHSFASSCSPRRLAATQLPSATRPWRASTGTSTPQVVRHRGRTIPAFAGMTVQAFGAERILLRRIESPGSTIFARLNTSANYA